MTRVLVVSPHPDDETLGAGGTILRHKALGDKVFWLNMTNMKEEFGYSGNSVARRKKEIEQVIREYKIDGFFDLGLRPAGLDGYSKTILIEGVSEVLGGVKPEKVILPYGGDVHTDHKIAFDVVSSASKIFRHSSVKKILLMETLSETNFSLEEPGFTPNCFYNIDDYFEKKSRIVKIYKSELKKHPFPRSVDSLRALAVLRGSQAGCKYAEAFKIIKWVE